VPTQGLGFAIPGDIVRAKVEEFKKAASSEKAGKRASPTSLARKYFGLQLQDLTNELSETLGYEAGSGVLVADVDPRSPAEEAGIKRGIVIYQIGRYGITSVKQVEELLELVGSGSPVDFTVGAIRRVRGQNIRQLQTISLTAR
jgi:S1-C subfamily serine protease